MNRKIIYVDNVGFVDPRDDHELILWFWEQNLKGKKPNVKTSFWLKTKAQYWELLKALQAFELMAKIAENVTDAQEKRSEYNKKKQQEKRAIEHAAFIAIADKNKFHRQLLYRAMCDN